MAVFVSDMLPGEAGRVKIIKTAKNYAVAIPVTRTTDSPMRVDPPCPVFRQCGGCTIMHLAYMGQLQYKDGRVRHTLKKAAPDAVINYPMPVRAALRYRNKTAFPVQAGEDGVKIGCYRKRSHDIVDEAAVSSGAPFPTGA